MLPNGCPFADAVEVFQGDATRGALSLANECLADAAVLDLTEAGLLACDLLEVTSGRPGICALEPMAEAGTPLPDLFRLGARMMVPVAVGGQVTDAEVYAEPAFGVNGGSFGHFHGHVEVELPLAGHEVRLTTNPTHLAPMVGPDDDGHDEPLVEGGEGHSVQAVFEGVEALVVGNGAVGSEARQCRFVTLVRLAHLGDAAHGKLGVEAEAGADLVVVEPLELDFIGGLQLKGFGREPVASLVEAGHEVHEGGLLCRLQEELAGGDQLHVHMGMASMDGGQGHFLPSLKEGASVACSRRVEVPQ
jgi:hypothetical protein